tara:strand:- start:855 stop:1901 length:1047 start_codon:yes stop_codon:yes gene_type:complete
MTKIEETANKIIAPDQKMRDIAKTHLNDLTKPPGSLGRLEELAEEIVFITGNKRPKMTKKVIFTLAGDHGVAEEGVSAFPQEVTGQMLLNFAHGGAAVNVLAKHAGADIKVVDMGVKGEIPENSGIINKKISNGTENMVKVPAMTRDNAVLALERGVELIEENSDYDVIGTGDMGIANTTASSAIIAVFTGEEVEKVTGRGTGISNTVLQHKIEVIEKAIKVNSPDPDDPIDVLSKVGGYEIGGIAGIILGAASKRIPVVVDGLIATAGALIAVKIEPKVKYFLVPSHLSVENGHKIALEFLNLTPYVDLNMRLGEGTGSALTITLIEAAVKIYNEMATFSSAKISKS